MKTKIVNLFSRIIKKSDHMMRSYRTRERHMANAATALEMVERGVGRSLSKCNKSAADAYAIEVLGSKEFAPWLYVYSTVQSNFHTGWIPRNFYQDRVLPEINKVVGEASHLKSLTTIFLKSDCIPDVGYYIDGVFYDKNREIQDYDSFRREIAKTSDEFFVKSDGSNRGLGIVRGTIDSFSEKFFEKIGSCVVQRRIQQHKLFDNIVTGSPATVRLTTVKRKDGQIEHRGAYLRLGRQETSWVRSDNSVKVAVEDDIGNLSSVGYTQDWKELAAHPDSGFLFDGFQIPEFEKALTICKALHAKVPHIAIVGWDIVVDNDNKINIIEWNGRHPGTNFLEATIGPCFTGLGWERFRA